MNAISAGRKATQAEVVIGKFGSACKLAKLLGVEDSTVYRWTYARANGGTDGIIPGPALRKVLEVAAASGVVITAQDLYPS
jgi:DNA-binding transcriptional regulator YdaS (Cro superfamily)